MTIAVNGEEREIEGPMTAAALLLALGVRDDAVAVEINRRVVPKAALGATMVVAGDRVEVVSFVGGG